jgi:hypothetical protein
VRPGLDSPVAYGQYVVSAVTVSYSVVALPSDILISYVIGKGEANMRTEMMVMGLDNGDKAENGGDGGERLHFERLCCIGNESGEVETSIRYKERVSLEKLEDRSGEYGGERIKKN